MARVPASSVLKVTAGVLSLLGVFTAVTSARVGATLSTLALVVSAVVVMLPALSVTVAEAFRLEPWVLALVIA